MSLCDSNPNNPWGMMKIRWSICWYARLLVFSVIPSQLLRNNYSKLMYFVEMVLGQRNTKKWAGSMASLSFFMMLAMSFSEMMLSRSISNAANTSATSASWILRNTDHVGWTFWPLLIHDSMMIQQLCNYVFDSESLRRVDVARAKVSFTLNDVKMNTKWLNDVKWH